MYTEKESSNYLNNRYKKYEIDSRNCNIDIFDKVTPDNVIGSHYANGRQVTSDFAGQVASMFYNPMHDSMLILIVEDETEIRDIPGLYLG